MNNVILPSVFLLYIIMVFKFWTVLKERKKESMQKNLQELKINILTKYQEIPSNNSVTKSDQVKESKNLKEKSYKKNKNKKK